MSKKSLKRYLMLLSAVGLLAVGTSGSGTFASFNAEVANTGNYFATGTLFLHATKQGGTTCTSEADTTGNSNILSTNGCDTLFNLPNITAGQTANVNLQLDNAGSLNATAVKFRLGAACTNGRGQITTVATSAVSSGAQTTITVSALSYKLFAGTVIRIYDGTNSEQLTLAADAASGATSINVTGSTLTNGYAVGSRIGFDTQFGSATLCSGLLITIQEKNAAWAASQKCVYPTGGGASCTFTGAPTVSAVGTTDNDLTADLWSGAGVGTAIDAGKSRFFTINIQAPASFTNVNQNRSATFDLVWRLDA